MTNKVEFDGVCKMGGVWASAGGSAWVAVKESEGGVWVDSPLKDGRYPRMTVAEARSLAAQIMEAARRHEIRTSK